MLTDLSGPWAVKGKRHHGRHPLSIYPAWLMRERGRKRGVLSFKYVGPLGLHHLLTNHVRRWLQCVMLNVCDSRNRGFSSTVYMWTHRRARTWNPGTSRASFVIVRWRIPTGTKMSIITNKAAGSEQILLSYTLWWNESKYKVIQGMSRATFYISVRHFVCR